MNWFKRNLDTREYTSKIQIVGTYLGRKVRVTDFDAWDTHERTGTVLQIGDCDFDRWANSIEAEIELDNSPTQKQLLSLLTY